MKMIKILVTYATRAGSTAQVAEAIAQTLGAAGTAVDVRPIKNVTHLEGYDAVVIGSAIRMGQWLPEAVEFVKNNQPVLVNLPTAYFLVSGFLRHDTPEMHKTVEAYLDPVRKILEPKSIGMFAGKMDYCRLSFLDRTLAKMMKEEEGDWRNWDAIGGWARDLLPMVAPA
jgi:menaquinone-dependent protoporphyrinogen oxidase